MKQLPPEITEAIRLYKAGDAIASRALLRDFTLNSAAHYEALLWLAKVSPDDQEAVSAATLAYSLDPQNEVAQRAVAAVRQRLQTPTQPDLQLDLLKLTGLTLAQARAVLWPFKGLKRPIGVLLDEQKLTTKELLFASENAYDETVKKASRVILLTLLFNVDQDHTPKPARVIQGKDYSGYLERMSSFNTGALMGVLGVVSLALIILPFLGNWLNLIPRSTATIASLILFPFLIFLTIVANQQIDKVVHARLGREGEQKFLDHLRAALREPWVIFHNFEFPHRK